MDKKSVPRILRTAKDFFEIVNQRIMKQNQSRKCVNIDDIREEDEDSLQGQSAAVYLMKPGFFFYGMVNNENLK